MHGQASSYGCPSGDRLAAGRWELRPVIILIKPEGIALKYGLIVPQAIEADRWAANWQQGLLERQWGYVELCVEPCILTQS